MEELRQTHVEPQVIASSISAGPVSILAERLLPELFANPPAFERTEPGNAFPPIPLLAGAHRRPIAADEVTNAARNHASIVRRGAYFVLDGLDSRCGPSETAHPSTGSG